MDCPQCGAANIEGFKFCMKCGANLPQDVLCEQCSTINPPGFRFCMDCGQPLGVEAASAEKAPAPAPPPPAPQAASPATPPPPPPQKTAAEQTLPPPAPPPAAQQAEPLATPQAPPPAVSPAAPQAVSQDAPPAPAQATPPASPPAPPPQPQVVIIKEEHKRRTPSFFWILIGMLLAVILCGVLLWTDVVEPPPNLVASLPDPLPEIVDAISHQQIPDLGGQARPAPGGDDGVAQAPQPQPAEPDPPAGDQAADDSTIILHNNSNETIFEIFFRRCSTGPWQWERPGPVPPGGTLTFSVPTGCYDLWALTLEVQEFDEEFDVYVDGTYHWYIDPPEEPSVDVCEEDLEAKLAISPDHIFTYGGNFSGDVYATFRANEPLNLDEYDLYVEQYGVTSGPYSGVAEEITSGQLEGMYEITITEPFQHLGGPLTFRFTPNGQGCVLGEQETVRACASSEDYHPEFPYNNGCCTRGCWCQQSGQWGCWTTCNTGCAD